MCQFSLFLRFKWLLTEFSLIYGFGIKNTLKKSKKLHIFFDIYWVLFLMQLDLSPSFPIYLKHKYILFLWIFVQGI